MERYIKLYEWIVQNPELSLREAVLIGYVSTYPNGCYESLSSIARHLGMQRKMVQRMLYGDRRGERFKEGLIKRGWLSYLPTSKHNRILYATLKYPSAGPLFEQEKNRQIQMQKEVRRLQSGLAAKWGAQ